jgi:Tfp pilus assembly protein PilV
MTRGNRVKERVQGLVQSTGRVRCLLANDSGSSFIDLMLALVVLTIGVLALADLQIVSSKGNTSSKSTNAAITVAEAKVEAIKNSLYGNIVAEAATPVTVQINSTNQITFTRQVTVTNNSPVSNSKTVKVIVTWSDQAGTHTVPMATVIAEKQ